MDCCCSCCCCRCCVLAIVVIAYKCSAVVVHDWLLLQAALVADNTALNAEVVRGAGAVPPMTHRAAACCIGRMECALIACRVCVFVYVWVLGCGAVAAERRGGDAEEPAGNSALPQVSAV